MNEVVFADEFIDALAGVTSDRIYRRVLAVVSSLAAMPELGSPDVRPSIVARFGANVRKLVVGPFDIFYIYDARAGEIHVDALVHQRGIR